MAWRIERIQPSAKDTYRAQYQSKCCGAKIAKRNKAIAAPTFTGLQRIYKKAGNEPKQFWFCPGEDLQCVKSTTCRWVAYYPPLLEKWPIKVGANLSQEEVFKLESVGFCLEDKVDAAGAMVLEAMLEDR